MESINPYKSPQATRRSPVGSGAGLQGAWRSGSLLVVSHEAELPDRCVKCNARVGNQRMRRKLAWHSPVAFLGLFLGLLPYIILALMMTKRLTLYVGVCEQHRSKRRNAILVGYVGFFAGFFLMIFFGVVASRGGSALLILIGFVLLLVALFYGMLASRVVWPKKIDKDLAWVKGACPEYLAHFPEYPADSGNAWGGIDSVNKRDPIQATLAVEDPPPLQTPVPQSVECPGCKRQYKLRDELLGKKVKCRCGETFAIPLSVAESSPPSPFDSPMQAPLADALADNPSLPPTRTPALSRPLPNRTAAGSKQRAASPLQSRALRIGLFMFLGTAGLGVIGLGLMIGARQWVSSGPQLPTEPYALDSATERTRVADGSVNAKFPDQMTFQPRKADPDIVFATVVPQVDQGQPGYNSELRVYEPAGRHASKSLGCVLVAAAGGSALQGSAPPSDADELEWLPYVKAGFAVVAFRQDGEIVYTKTASEAQMAEASSRFFAAQAGLVNARNALEFALARMSEVDPKRIYIAARSSAGTMALLFAEHESRIRACIAYAPVANVEELYEGIFSKKKPPEQMPEFMRQLLVKTSPSTHAAKLSCPLLLFHADGDANAATSKSRPFAQQLQRLGKSVTVVTVPPGHQTMLTQGIPTAIEWLQDLEHPEQTADRKQRRAEAAQAGQVATAKQAAENQAKSEAQALEAQLSFWLTSAQGLAKELAQVTDASSADISAIHRLNFSTTVLTSRTTAVLTRFRAGMSKDITAPISLVSAPTRQKLADVNRTLLSEKQRLEALSVRELQQSGLLSQLQGCLLPAWFLEARPPSAQELAADQKAGEKNETARTARAKPHRDFREDAKWALRMSKPQDALKLLRADLLIGDDRSIEEGMKWSPALKRPAMLLQWAFGAELKGFPGAGPANLRPQAGSPQAPRKNTGSELALGRQLKSLSGDIGNWLAEGLQNRIDSGGFGDWGQDSHRGFFDHPGITLLDFAPVDGLLDSAKSQNADLLLALVLTMSRGENAKPTTTMMVQIHDVQTGDMLWESKGISNTRILSAQRQGKDLASEFAGTALEFIDGEILLREIPKLSEETIEERLKSISVLAKSDPLSASIELRYLKLAKYFSDANAQDQLAQILGEQNAKRLLSAEAEDRRAAIEQFVPKGR
jgi:dienelactone hydrolase